MKDCLIENTAVREQAVIEIPRYETAQRLGPNGVAMDNTVAGGIDIYLVFVPCIGAGM